VSAVLADRAALNALTGYLHTTAATGGGHSPPHTLNAPTEYPYAPTAAGGGHSPPYPRSFKPAQRNVPTQSAVTNWS
jgi:hypothetical protein